MLESSPMRNSDIRESNEKMILGMIRGSGGMSQSEIVTQTGLKAPTVLRTFTNLEEAGVIEPFNKKVDLSEKKGRKPVFYRVKPDSMYSLGMEFWSGGASFTVENFDQDIILDEMVAIEKGMDWESVIYYLQEKVEEVIKLAAVPRNKILGLGIGVPGKVDVVSGEVVHYSRFDNFKTVNIKKIYEEKLGLDVTVCNNSSAVAYGEYYFGRTGGYNSAFAFMMRGGMGGVFINRGQVFSTNNRTSIEVGHMSVDYQGRKCECGNRGCLETYLSEKALLKDLGFNIAVPSVEDLNNALDFSSEKVCQVLDEKALVLSQVIRNLASILSPEIFIFITRNEQLGKYLAARAENYLKINPSNRWQFDIRILPMLYEPSSGSRGAAELIFRNSL